MPNRSGSPLAAAQSNAYSSDTPAGHSNRDLASTLGMAPDTVKWHLKNIFGKLGVANRTQAVLIAQDATVHGKGAARGILALGGTIAVDGPTLFLWGLVLLLAIAGLLLFAERHLDGGVSAFDLLTTLIWPTMELLQQLYRDDRVSVSSLNLATRLNRSMTDQVSARLERNASNGKKVLIFCGNDEPER